MPFFTHTGTTGPVELYYDIQGSGPMLLLLHNGFYSSRSWEPVIQLLAESFCCVSWDRQGYGRSATGETIEASLASGAAEIDSLLARLTDLGMDTGSFHIWGHCMGAAIAVEWLSSHPARCRSLILEACGFFADPEIQRRTDLVCRPWEKMPRSLRTTMETMHGPHRAALVWSFIIQHTSSYVMEADYDLRPRLSALNFPVLLANGDHDVYFSREHAQAGAALIEDCRLWLPDDCGHDIHRERSQEFAQLCQEFCLGSSR